MAETVTYSLEELRSLRDGLDEILNHLEAHPFRDIGGGEGPFEQKRQLRRTGFTLYVKFGKGGELPIMPAKDQTLSVFNLSEIGFNPCLLSQVLNQLIATMEMTP